MLVGPPVAHVSHDDRRVNNLQGPLRLVVIDHQRLLCGIERAGWQITDYQRLKHSSIVNVITSIL